MTQGIYRIQYNRQLTADVWEMRLEGDTGAITAPGQFINIRLDGLFLRRPISICDWDGQGITIIYKVVGKGTAALGGMEQGQELDVLCGLGNGFDVSRCGERTLVIGGGVIGLEMACYFATVGVPVTVIEMMDKIAGDTDPEICKVLTDDYKKRGLKIKTSCKVLEVTGDAVIYEEKGERQEAKCDMALLSTGRRPATAGLGLEKLGIETDGPAVVTDRRLCTNVAGVYAVGDCNGKLMLAHTAYREAEVAVNHMLGIPDEMRYEVVPAVIYTDPEVASVGESKASAEAKGMTVKEVKLPLGVSGRYAAENQSGRGFIKLIVDTDRNRLAGCQMVGSYASEIIMTATMMVDTELPPERLKKLVFPHPTVAEGIREAIFQI